MSRVATGMFGSFDVVTLREVVDHIDDYSETDAIYVADVIHLGSNTPAIVVRDGVAGAVPEFRYLSDIDDARETVWNFGEVTSEDDFEVLCEQISDWGA